MTTEPTTETPIDAEHALRRDVDRWLDEGMSADQFDAFRAHVEAIRDESFAAGRAAAQDIVRAYGVSIGWAGGPGDAVSEVLHLLETTALAHPAEAEPTIGTAGSICKCGLAKSYHPRLADHEYEPRYVAHPAEAKKPTIHHGSDWPLYPNESHLSAAAHPAEAEKGAGHE